LHASQSIIRSIKSKRMRWAEHVTHMGRLINAYNTLAGKHEGKRSAEDPGVDGRIILEWILRKYCGKL